MTGLLYYLTLVIGLLAFALLGPVAVAMLVGEGEVATQFFLLAGLTGFVAGAGFLALRGRDHRLPRVASYVLALAIWSVPPLIAAIPFVGEQEATYVDALFEAVSGFTTTGASVFPQIDGLPRALVFWRAELQWLGGLITLIMLIGILGAAGLGGLPSSRVGFLTIGEGRTARRSMATLRGIAIGYVGLTAACLFLLGTSGIPLFDAICLAFATVSTGGFMPRDGGLGIYDSSFAGLILSVFMLLAATNILWQRMLVRGQWAELKAHRESYWLVGVAIFVGLAYALLFEAGLGAEPGTDTADALRDGLLTAISLVTTTGFVPTEDAFSVMPLPLVIILALAGGATFSTAGGLKYYRIGAMFVQTREELRRLVHPHNVRVARLGSELSDLPMVKAIWGHFVASLFLILAASLLLALEDIDYEGALLMAVACFSNVGNIYDNTWAGSDSWPAYADLADGRKLTAMATMILGRIEVIAALSAASLLYWRS